MVQHLVKIKGYRSWQHMKARCYDANDNYYHNYGGRGIIVCDEWKNNFITFINDMGVRPDNHSIERIDVNGNYCKENCKWATRKEQSLNKTNTFIVTYKNETKSLFEFCEELNLNYFTIRQRIYKLKWSTEIALTTPIRNFKRKKKYEKINS